MIRRLFTAASMLSLALCLFATALWLRSYRVGDALGKYTPARETGITSRSGELMYYDQINPPQIFSLLPPGSMARPAPWSYSASNTLPRPQAGDETWLNRRGVSFEWRERNAVLDAFPNPLYQTETRIVVPHSLVAMPLAILPAIWLAARRRSRIRERRLRQSCCTSCGYDLRASADRCPECGTPIPAKL